MANSLTHSELLARVPVGKCRACPAQIMWALTPAGKKVPIDAAPIEGAKYAIAGFNAQGVPLLRDRLEFETHLKSFASHFTTCPKAGRFSKGKSHAR